MQRDQMLAWSTGFSYSFKFHLRYVCNVAMVYTLSPSFLLPESRCITQSRHTRARTTGIGSINRPKGYYQPSRQLLLRKNSTERRVSEIPRPRTMRIESYSRQIHSRIFQRQPELLDINGSQIFLNHGTSLTRSSFCALNIYAKFFVNIKCICCTFVNYFL